MRPFHTAMIDGVGLAVKRLLAMITIVLVLLAVASVAMWMPWLSEIAVSVMRLA